MPEPDAISLRDVPLSPPTLEERLTAQFYAWERRGRGWQVWPEPVDLEPPFRPFLCHYAAIPSVVDDGRKPTGLQTWWDSFRGKPSPDILPEMVELPEDEPLPEFVEDAELPAEFAISLPASVKTSKEATDQWLMSLRYAEHPLSFEIIGVPDAIHIQMAASQADAPHVHEALRAHFPEAAIGERQNFLTSTWQLNRDAETVAVDFGLSREFMLPLRTYRGFDLDPLIGVAGALGDLQEGETALVQLLLQPARYPWAESIMRAVLGNDGGPFFADAPEIVALARQKVSQPLFAATLRIATRSEIEGRAWDLAKRLAGSLQSFTNPGSNELIPLTNDEYDDRDHIRDIVARQSRRSGMLLNLDEVTSLAHLPSSSVRSPKLVRESEKSKPAPAIALGHRLVLGENIHHGHTVPVTLGADLRMRHMHLIGASGSGKSTLLLNLIRQDIAAGEGLAVLDPHGDLIDAVLAHIPDERHRDVVLFDPTDIEYPIGFNVLRADSELENNVLASDLVAVFRRLSTSWGDQMTSVFGNAILAFLESDRGGTLADLRRFLVEPDFRREFLTSVRDPGVTYYWQKEFPLLKGIPHAPILTRLDTFLRPKLIRNMVSQTNSRLSFSTVMNSGTIFLAKLAQGMIGEENAHLLGGLLVAQFHQAAMGRQERAAHERRDFYLYIDEAHHFITPSMAAILSGARKYRLGLILAHQELQQLRGDDESIASAVLTNPATRICFRVGDADAKKLAEGFSFFEASDLQNLPVGEAICRIERSECDFNLKTLPVPPVPPELARDRSERIRDCSRERYAGRKEDIEAHLARLVGSDVPRAPEVPKAPSLPVPPPPPAPTAEYPAPSASASVPEERHPITPSRQLGRGGAQHKYLQNLIKRWAVSKGYHTVIEQPILDGLGSVDVALERGGISIACEISVSTSLEHEIGNLQKCLAAGFGHVVLVTGDRKMVAKAEAAVGQTFSADERARIAILTPETFFDFVETLEAHAAGREERVHGYTVKVAYRKVAASEAATKHQAISQVIYGALKQLKKSDK